MIRKRSALPVALLLLACGAAAGCEGSGGGGGEGDALRIGTTSYIDSLNPFVALQAQAYSAFTMEYPKLVQYVKADAGPKLQGDWATEWKSSKGGKTWTFELKDGGKWSDGTPLTAEDAAWTGNTILKYQSGPTAALAAPLAHVKRLEAVGGNTLVIEYDAPVSNALAQLDQFWVLPKHVWKAYAGNGGKDLKTFRPEQHLPTVSAGPYSITKYEQKGVTAFEANPHYYGTEPHTDRVLLAHYTESTAQIAALKAGNLDFIEKVPYSAVDSIKSDRRFEVDSRPGAEVTNITINSNPKKPRNRELLDPQVRKALEYATDREEIVRTVFHGHARPWANLLSPLSASWIDDSIKPLPFDLDEANEILDKAGFRRGADGTRVVPATTGKYAQAAHKMAYELMVPGSLTFNGKRQFQILAEDWAKIGIKLTQVDGGDATQSFAYETAGEYTKFDLATWNSNQYVDPDAQLSYLTKGQWHAWNDTGYDNPAYDEMYARQGTLVDAKERRALVQRMQRTVAEDRPYIQLVNADLLSVSSTQWTGFQPGLSMTCKCYFTSPRTAS